MSLEDQTDDELVRNAAHWGRYETPELIRRLKNSIEKLDASSTRQQEEMIRLTRWICGLTWVMAFVGVVQVAQIIFSAVRVR